jgi:hypothetical protein
MASVGICSPRSTWRVTSPALCQILDSRCWMVSATNAQELQEASRNLALDVLLLYLL